MSRCASIALGDIKFDVDYEVHGGCRPATDVDPPESPELELRRLTTPGGEDITGLLEFPAVYEHILEKVTDREREDDYYRDDDDAYDRWRDAQLERT